MWAATAKFRRCQTALCRVPLPPDTLAIYCFNNQASQRIRYFCHDCREQVVNPYVLYRNPQVTFFLDYFLTQGTYFQLLVDTCLRRYLFEFTSTKPTPRVPPSYNTWQYIPCDPSSNDDDFLKVRASIPWYANRVCKECHIVSTCSTSAAKFCVCPYCKQPFTPVTSRTPTDVTVKYPDRIY